MPRRHLPKLHAALLDLVFDAAGDKCFPTAEIKARFLTGGGWRQLLHLLFYGKRIFPDPERLRQAGVEVIAFDLCAGQCLIANGGCAHWGVNQNDETISLSTNALSESWLKVRRYLA